jgi:hypothetical protein
MGVLRWILGGLLGGAAGVLIWVLVGYFTHYEVGWIAWGVGLLVGVGVRYAAYLGDQEESFAQGILAAAMAIGAIFTAKFLLFSALVGGAETEGLHDVVGQMGFDDEAMIASIADEVAQEMMNQGRKLQWPPGMSYEEATHKADYPADVWRQAEARWKQLGPQGQQERKRERVMLIAALSEATSQPDFGEFFSPWDLLWFALATITAYKTGVGTYGDD